MQTYLAAILIGVHDVQEACDWYAKVFGMQLLEQKLPYFSEMILGDQHFLIEKSDPSRAVGFQDIPTGVRISAVIGVDDIHRFVDTVRAYGVRIVAEPVQQAWGGRNAIIADPYNNEIIIDQDDWS